MRRLTLGITDAKKNAYVQPGKDVHDNTYAHCLAEYKVNDKQEEWLCCPLCKKCFYES